MFVEPGDPELNACTKTDPTAPARSSIRRARPGRYPSSIHNNRNRSPSRSRWQRSSHEGSLAGRRVLPVDHDQRAVDAESRSVPETLMHDIYDLELAIARHVPPRRRDGHVFGAHATHRSRMEVERGLAAQSVSPPTRRESTTPVFLSLADGDAPRVDHDDDLSQYSHIQQRDHSSRQASIRRGVPTQGHHQPFRRRHPSQSPPLTPGFPPAHGVGTADAHVRRSTRMIDIVSLANQVRDLRVLPHAPHEVTELDGMLSDLNAMISRDVLELSRNYIAMENTCISSIRQRLERLRSEAIRVLDSHLSRTSNSEDVDGFLSATYHRSSSNPGSSHEINGLGDRERSVSPEIVAWETLVTTIPPDDQVPSNQSSFTSEQNSAPALSFESPTSQHSRLTSDLNPLMPDSSPCPYSEHSNEGDITEGSRSQRLPSSQAPPQALQSRSQRPTRADLQSGRMGRQRSHFERRRHLDVLEREVELQRLGSTIQRLDMQLEQVRSSEYGPGLDNVRNWQERL